MISSSIETLNLDEVLDDLSDHFPDEEHSLTVSNDAEHAHYVHAMHGLSVINPQHTLRMVRQQLSRLATLSDENIEAALEAAGREDVEWLQSHIGTKDGRPMHPGMWADESGELHDRYDYDVD